MTIGEYHPYKLIRGKLYRQIARDKWLACDSVPMDWRYYEGEEKDHPRGGIGVDRHYPIVVERRGIVQR